MSDSRAGVSVSAWRSRWVVVPRRRSPSRPTMARLGVPSHDMALCVDAGNHQVKGAGTPTPNPFGTIFAGRRIKNPDYRGSHPARGASAILGVGVGAGPERYAGHSGAGARLVGLRWEKEARRMRPGQ